MTERILTPSAAVGGGKGSNLAQATSVNAIFIAAVIDRLGANMQRINQLQKSLSKNDIVETSNLCISLSRGIDFAVANHEVPSRASELPVLLKQVCQCRDNPGLRAAVLILMVSVKSACENRWFSEEDSESLYTLAHEVIRDFCTTMDFNTEPSSCNVVIAEIMSRFYPKLVMGQILTFLEIKPGYGAYVKDFQIAKSMKYSPEEKVKLFVACTDNTETSACLINPQKVNFLINGKEVDKRTRLYVVPGSQMPTNVTSLMKYGSNVLQALGQFDGNYVIVVALMSELSAIENANLQDYVQPDAITEDPDSELIVGASRISLNCPISFTRIKTPVKGQSCKHFQCFDLDNYMAMNSKNPSWRCPHCNHHCCFPEIRVDQNIAKILKEVGENVNNVIISSDGSWKTITENNDDSEKQQTKIPRLNHDGPDSSAPLDLMDLTENDDVTVTGCSEAEDVKLLRNSSANQSSIQNMTRGPFVNSTNEVEQNSLPPAGDSFWSGLYMSTFQLGTTSALSDPQVVFEHTSLLTDSGASMSNTGVGPLRENNYQHLLQPVIRTPVAVQALPAQTRTNTSTLPLGASQTSALPGDSLGAHLSDIEERLQNSRPHPSVVQVSQMSYQQQHSNPQDRTMYPAIAQAHGSYQMQSGPPGEAQASSPREATNLRGLQLHTANHSAARFQQSVAAYVNTLTPQGTPRHLLAQRAAQMSRAYPNSMGTTPQSAQRLDGTGVNVATDQDWRPTGRMRGSLSGQAYSAALNQYAVRAQPSPNSATRTPGSAARPPPPSTNSSPPNSAMIQVLMGNRAAMHAVNTPSSGQAPSGPGSGSGSGSGSYPPRPTGLQ